METIDDDCDDMDIVFVCVKVWSLANLLNIHYYYQDKALAAKYNIDEFPTLEFFKAQIPSVYDGELEKPGEVLTWINDLLTGADIEQVRKNNFKSIRATIIKFLKITNDILDKFIATKSYLAVVFFKEDHKPSDEALMVLEEIDDDLDEHGIMFVKLDDEVRLSYLKSTLDMKSKSPFHL